MILLDYTNVKILFIAVMFFITMNIIGYTRKKAWYMMTSVIISLAMLILHVLLSDFFEREALKFNVYIDFICLGINIPMLLIVDEIETRRSVIKEVFESRYKKK